MYVQWDYGTNLTNLRLGFLDSEFNENIVTTLSFHSVLQRLFLSSNLQFLVVNFR